MGCLVIMEGEGGGGEKVLVGVKSLAYIKILSVQQIRLIDFFSLFRIATLFFHLTKLITGLIRTQITF